MKLSPPNIPVVLEPADLDDLIAGSLEGMSLVEIDAMKQTLLGLDLDGVLIEKGQFTGAHLMRMQAKDLRIVRSDFSSAILNDGGLFRVEWRDSRLVGTNFSKTILHDISFVGCKLDLANFRFSDLRRVRFESCTLSESDFLGARLHDVVFSDCQLEKTVFDQTTCTKLDLRGSHLTELSGWGSLKGATIDSAQLAGVAPYLAQTLGLSVRDS